MNEVLKRDEHVVQEERFDHKGFPCVILFMDMGHRCGYVGFPRKLLGKFDTDEIGCHGGITYENDILRLQDDANVWWIGFDCAHYGDRRDIEKVKEYFGPDSYFAKYIDQGFTDYGQIRTLEYCKEECKRIVDQVVDMIGVADETIHNS